MRVAFVTSEYPTELPDGGGLGNYVHRMAKLLLASGHEAEVFVPSLLSDETQTYDGVPVHRIRWRDRHPLVKFLFRGGKALINIEAWRDSTSLMAQAWGLSSALERRHKVAPFELIQSSDYLAPGLFISRRSDRVHAVRCSTAADLYSAFDGTRSAKETCRAYLERFTMRRADKTFAPSRFVADHFATKYGIEVGVIRPPLFREHDPSTTIPFMLPERFLFHFGQLIDRKGTGLLARALPVAWRRAPDLTMVWSGHVWDAKKLDHWRQLWGSRAGQVVITGPLKKPDVYAVLFRADAAVLPSQVDNLPNTVIESLMFGIPVVGTRGASIDELVEDGIDGHLVPLGDAESLGEVLASVWLGKSPVRKGFLWRSRTTQEMTPERAMENLLSLAAITKRAR